MGRQTGFSLIELVIAVVIMGILIAAALPSYRNWIENSQIRTAAESVLGGVQLARAEAARRNANVGFMLNGNDWTVKVLANGSASSVFYTPETVVQNRSASEGSRHAVITATPSTVSYNATNFSGVAFSGLGRVSTTPASSVTFAITNPTGGSCATTSGGTGMRCLNIVVETGGRVRMCDPLLDGSGNPQACVP